jgi:hypothetical protein
VICRSRTWIEVFEAKGIEIEVAGGEAIEAGDLSVEHDKA